MNEAEIHTLAAPYALHALPPDETILFERHLKECRACRAEVDEIRETSARLGMASEIPVPPELKSQVMDRISEVRRLPPLVGPADGGGDPGAAGDGGEVVELSRWRRWWPVAASGLAAAMAAVVVVLGVTLGDTRDELEQAQAVGAQMRELVEAPDMEMVRADGDGATGTVLMARSLDAAVLIADGMDPAPTAHTYQLWFMADDGIRSAGVLGDVDDGRLGPFTADGLGDAAMLGITVEPDGGSEQPTTDPVMMIELPA